MPVKNSSEIEENRNKHFVTIGARLKEIRTQEKLSIGHIEEELCFSKRTISRIEGGEGGSLKSFVSLILFYNDLGYNLNWMLLENNSEDFKKGKNMTVTVDLGIASNLVEEASHNISEIKKIFDKLI